MTALGVAAVRSRMLELSALTGASRPGRHDFARLLEAQTGARVSPTDAPSSSGPEASGQAPAVALDRPVAMTHRSSATLGTMLGSAPTQTVAPMLDAALPEAAHRWTFAIEAAADKAGIDPRLLAAVTWAESRFNPDAVSSAGAIGLTQLMPGTAAGLGVDPHDPIQNLEGGARYLAWTIEEFGSIELGLAAYNAGPGTVRNAGGIPAIAETQAYVPKVLEYFRLLGGTP